MAEPTITIAFEDDGVVAISDGVVVASGTDADDVKSDAVKYLEEQSKDKDKKKKEAARKTATHVQTPNGLTGQILNRTASWDSDENVTVRFENGRVVTLATSKLPQEAFLTDITKEASADNNPISILKTAFAEDFDRDRDSLVARVAQLDEIIADAREILADGAAYTDERDLDEVVVHAEAEKSELAQAIEHLDSVDNELAAPTPTQVFEQAQLGDQRGGDWLDDTFNQMTNEAEGQDFVKLLDDGPTEFISEQSDDLLAEQGLVAASVRDFIEARTAGLTGDEADKFREVFVERAELARRAELSSRKAAARTEASVEKTASVDEGPDEGLFL
jgi:hypothetical protein